MALTSDDGDRRPLGDPRSHAQMVQIGGTPLAADCPTHLNQTSADLALCDPAWFRFGGTGLTYVGQTVTSNRPTYLSHTALTCTFAIRHDSTSAGRDSPCPFPSQLTQAAVHLNHPTEVPLSEPPPASVVALTSDDGDRWPWAILDPRCCP